MTTLTTQTITASGTAAVTANVAAFRGAMFLLNVTSAASQVGDTLDVYIQQECDTGVWDDFVHFTQVLGNGGAKKYLAYWVRDLAPTTAQGAPNDGALAAGVSQGPKTGSWRVKWVVVNGGGTHAFTFSVGAHPLR